MNKKENTHTLVGDKCPPLPIKRDKFSRRTSHKNNNSFSPGKIFIKLKQRLSHNQSHVTNFCRVSLLGMNKFDLKNIAIILQDNQDHEKSSIYFQWYFLALNIIDSKILEPTISKAKRKALINICKIFSLINNMELVRVSYVFHDPLVKACLATDIKCDDRTDVSLMKKFRNLSNKTSSKLYIRKLYKLLGCTSTKPPIK